MTEARISGVIVSGDFDDEWFDEFITKGIITPSTRFAAAVAAADDELTVCINSCGGDVTAANDMQIAVRLWLQNHPEGKLTYRVEGEAASAAANIVAKAPQCATVQVFPETMLMFHSCYLDGWFSGGAGALRDAADYVDKINGGVIKALTETTTLDETTVRGWFAEGRMGWLSADDCMSCGLADAVIDGETPALPEPFDFDDAAIDADDTTIKLAARLKSYVASFNNWQMNMKKEDTQMPRKLKAKAEDEEVKIEQVEEAPAADPEPPKEEAPAADPEPPAEEAPAPEQKAECGDSDVESECGDGEKCDGGECKGEDGETAAEDAPAEDAPAETEEAPAEETPAEDPVVNALKAEIAELKAELASVKKTIADGGLKTHASKSNTATAPRQMTFKQRMDEAAKLPRKEYDRAILQLRRDYPEDYKAWLKSANSFR